MKALPLILSALVGVTAGQFMPGLEPATARDHGQVGEAWPVIEPDLLDVIRTRLQNAEATGELDDLNTRFAERVKAKVMRPTPVAGVSAATEHRSWEFDPTITVEGDIKDHKGNLIAAAGQRINPLDSIALSQKLIFIDGDIPAQVAWAMGQGDDTKAKIIMVKGSPFDLMKSNQRRFYFDQEGSLVEKFGIEHTPASVEQSGKLLLVKEVALRSGGRS